MNSSNFNKFIEDFSSINSSNTESFARVLRKHPYFQTAALFLAKSNPIQAHTQTAALRSADRRVLRSWLDENYRKELEKEKQDIKARKIALEIENDKKKENLDINTESINAFDKLVGTTTIVEKKENTEEKLEEIHQEIETVTENKVEDNTPVNSFFDEIEGDDSLIKTEIIENKVDSSNFFDDLEDSEELEKTSTTTRNSDANFFDQVDENELEESIFEEQSSISDSLPAEIVSETLDKTIDSNFFDEVDDNELEEPIFKEQSDINDSLSTKTTSEIPATATDANFFDEIESDDEIFGDAQNDLDNYTFPDFEEEEGKNNKTDEGGSFFDDI